MEKIKWCCEIKKGIRLIDVSERISKEYLKESEEDLEEAKKAGRKWKMISSYYSCYNILYSILIRCGIKSEIHDCSIALMEVVGFDKEDVVFMEEMKIKRIDV